MTTLRDRIAALVEKACRHDPKDNHTFEDDADRILALFRDEAPPSAVELAAVCDGGQWAWKQDRRALYDLGHARGIASGEAERAELQRRLEESEALGRSVAQTADNILAEKMREREWRTEAERERDAALSELRQGSMRLAVEALRATGYEEFMAAIRWLEAEARKAGAGQ